MYFVVSQVSQPPDLVGGGEILFGCSVKPSPPRLRDREHNCFIGSAELYSQSQLLSELLPNNSFCSLSCVLGDPVECRVCQEERSKVNESSLSIAWLQLVTFSLA